MKKIDDYDNNVNLIFNIDMDVFMMRIMMMMTMMMMMVMMIMVMMIYRSKQTSALFISSTAAEEGNKDC